MNQKNKKEIFQKAKAHVEKTVRAVKKEKSRVGKMMKKSEKDFSENSLSDKYAFRNFILQGEKRLKELSELQGSPYFVRCDLVYHGEKEKKQLYFSKFQLAKNDVYSWVAPAAAVRFEEPGEFSFRKPNGKLRKGEMIRKDQFMIVDGKIIFLSTESKNSPRELIYQEHFSKRKTDFILPEIVAQMEKAQDQVIRAGHIGPLVISGPAGSGKTTLALHRVAYLIQSPDLNKIYQAKSIIVFVQDKGTQEYFSHLLPELGIENVRIITFADWAKEILEIRGCETEVRFGKTEEEKDKIEEEKIEVLRSKNFEDLKYTKSVFSNLKKAYENSNFLKEVIKQQQEKKIIDRIDLNILLRVFQKKFGSISSVQEYYTELQNGKFRKKKERLPIKYSLVVIDEFQNYLPEQLKIIKTCAKKRYKSILYVGELAQQVRLGTIREWNEIGEGIGKKRKVLLQKVYRNTKNILEFIKNLGYEIEVPKELRDGQPVVERVFYSAKEEIEYVKKQLSKLGKQKGKLPGVGILAKEKGHLRKFEKEFGKKSNIKVFSIREVQGVEFEIVFLVGVKKDSFRVKGDYQNEGVLEERKRIQKNLLYIALTRAMNELYILGEDKLSRKFLKN